MKTDDLTVADQGDEDELHHDRLMALLHELVRKHGGRRGAARVLGIDRRTVAACMDGREMSWRMKEALERALQNGVGPAPAQQRERNEALEQRVDALEREVHEGLDAVRGEIGKLREEHSRALCRLERPLACGQAPRESPVSDEASSAAGQGPEKAQPATRPAAANISKRLYPELVTKGARAGRRGGVRRSVAARRGLAQAVGDPLRSGQRPSVAGGRGARPRAGGCHAGRARADAAAGDDATDGPVAKHAAELAQGDPQGRPEGGGLATVGEAYPDAGYVEKKGGFQGARLGFC